MEEQEVLRVVSLSKNFALNLTGEMNVHPIENVHFKVNKGTFLGIAGPSGVGKSTILKCIYRTYLPSGGHVWYRSELFGVVDLACLDERRVTYLRRMEMGYVSQFLKVIPRVTALDVVAEGLWQMGYAKEDAREQAIRMLRNLHIPEILWNAYPATFSGGEQQRINLARAFVRSPRLLILDEPTSALDEASKEVVLSLLHQLKDAGTTMVGVFHDWEAMREIADEIIKLTPQERAVGPVSSRKEEVH